MAQVKKWRLHLNFGHDSNSCTSALVFLYLLSYKPKINWMCFYQPINKLERYNHHKLMLKIDSLTNKKKKSVYALHVLNCYTRIRKLKPIVTSSNIFFPIRKIKKLLFYFNTSNIRIVRKEQRGRLKLELQIYVNIHTNFSSNIHFRL